MSTQISAIEDLVAQAAPIHVILRLICLASLTTGGIKIKIFENLKREILQVCMLFFGLTNLLMTP